MGEVCLTELETAILSVFIKNKVLNNDTIVHELAILIEKLKQAPL